MPQNGKPSKRGFKRLFLKALLLLAGTGLALSALLLLAVHLAKPSATERTEIAPGVFYEVFEAESPGAEGVVMVAEIHWETPGVEIGVRPFDERALAQGRHYTLEFADWALARDGDAVVLINGTRYTPPEWYRSYPGNTVRTLETIVADGVLSHVHEKSYLLWWDNGGRATFETAKPPSEKAQELAAMGISVQGISVENGRSRHQAVRAPDGDRHYPRSFIGIDAEKKILWLITYESATATYMARFAAERGVITGGMLDSENAANLLVGRQAKGVFPFTGLRNPRPLGNHITIRYKPADGP